MMHLKVWDFDSEATMKKLNLFPSTQSASLEMELCD